MTRTHLVLGCAAAALIGGAALAQDVFTQPPLNNPDVETAAQDVNEGDRLAPPETASPEAATAATPTPQNSSAEVSTDGAWTTQSQGAAVEPANPAGDTAVNPQPSDASAEFPATTADNASAPTPAAQPASATTTSSMAYAANIANAPGGVFKANVGDYPMSHYTMPSRPLPYDQVDAYLRASRSQQLAQNWWGNDQLASTATPSDVSASTPAQSDDSASTPAASDVSASVPDQASGTAGLPGDTDVSLNDETSTAQTPSPAPSATDPSATAPPFNDEAP